MAMIDYGAITWRDGRCISTGMFDDMKKMVGWCDDGTSGYNEGRYLTCPLNGNYMSYIGDKYFTLAFYKNTMCIYRKSNIDGEAPWVDTMYFGGYFHKIDFSEYAYASPFDYNDYEARIKVYKKPFHNYYVCKMRYGGHKYKVAFGYGVDYSYYKKTHIVDYYGTPWFKVKSWWRDFKSDIGWKFKELTGQIKYADVEDVNDEYQQYDRTINS
jgi:hypothetical protein